MRVICSESGPGLDPLTLPTVILIPLLTCVFLVIQEKLVDITVPVYLHIPFTLKKLNQILFRLKGGFGTWKLIRKEVLYKQITDDVTVRDKSFDLYTGTYFMCFQGHRHKECKITVLCLLFVFVYVFNISYNLPLLTVQLFCPFLENPRLDGHFRFTLKFILVSPKVSPSRSPRFLLSYTRGLT